jgi:hypothetical protein
MGSDKAKNRTNSILILLIPLIIVIILFAVLSINVTNPGYTGPPSCIAKSGYICKIPTYGHTTANIIVTLGQNTGTNWTGANFIFVPQGIALTNGIPNIGGPAFSTYPANTSLATTPLTAGENLTIYLPATGPVQVGTQLQGTIWVAYTTTIGGPIHYADMASIKVPAS